MKTGRGHYDCVGGGGNSKAIMDEFLETLEINELSLDIEPTDSHGWGLPYEAGFYSIPDGGIKFTITPVTIRTEDWLDFQNMVHGESNEWDTFRQGAYEPTVQSVATDIENGDVEDIPTPVLEIRYDGTATYDEGRSRGFGAKEAGVERMPLWVAVMDYL